MSGFEIVGVVLGSVPLIISGLEHYRDGIETIGSMIRYVEVVKNILASVSTTLSIYRQSCEVLLERLILPENTLDELLNNPNSAAWADEELTEQLKKQFGSHAEYDAYRMAVVRFNKRLEKLRSKLDLGKDFQPVWMISHRVDADLLAKFFTTGRELRRRVKVGFNDNKYMDLADALEGDVNRISTLIGGARTLEPIRADRRAREVAKHWLKVGDCARRLFTSLSLHWSQACPCEVNHVASLPLDIVDVSHIHPQIGSSGRFEILLSFEVDEGSTGKLPWHWKVSEVEPRLTCMDSPMVGQLNTSSRSTACVCQTASTPAISLEVPRNTTQVPQAQIRITETPIPDLCDALSRAKTSGKCLGFIHDDSWQHYLHLVHPRNEPDGQGGFSSLEQVLSDSVSMGTKTKYKIAAALASAVLQFHATPWLNNKWDCTHIFFLQDRDKHIQTDRPYVSKRFIENRSQMSVSRRRDPSVSNEITFALGVALIELSYGKRLLELQEPEDLDENGNVDVLTKVEIAKRLVGKLESRDGAKYADVVDRCIRCRFDTISTNLEDPVFLMLFYQGVLKPLQDIYNSI